MRLEAIRGIMGSTEFYFTSIPFRNIPKLFKPYFLQERHKNNPFEKYQREISESRVAKIEKYLLENPDFVLPSVAVSIEGDITFIESSDNYKLGILEISDDALWIINDGQHRIKAIYHLINLFNLYEKDPRELSGKNRRFVRKNYERLKELSFESLPVQIFVNLGTERNQQIFSDINRTAKKTPKSLDILFDNRDELAVRIKSFLQDNEELARFIELEKTTTKDKAYTIVDLYNVAKVLGDDFEEFIIRLANTFEFNLPEDKEKYIYPFSIFITALAYAYKQNKNIFENLSLDLLEKEKLNGICIFDGKIKKDKKTIDRLKEYILYPQYSLI